MIINFNIHNRNHFIKSILGNIEYLLTNSRLSKNELIVVNYHGTPQKFISNFRKQIIFFEKKFAIISPDQLSDFYAGKLLYDRPLILLTFDDGIKNNLHAAAILNEYNLKAFFFIVPDFINTSLEKQKTYFISHIRPKINFNIYKETEDFIALTWDELKTLQNQGHSIGSHTLTHQLIAKQSSLKNSIREIQKSKTEIAYNLKIELQSIDSFCSINNTLESISEKELQLIKDSYQYHFTTIPGHNYSNSSPLYIKRSNIESYWLLGALKYAIGKWDHKRWADADNTYLNMLKSKKI